MHTQISFHLVTINSIKFPRISLKFSSLECESKSKIVPKGNEYLKYLLTIKFIFNSCEWKQVHNGKIQEREASKT